MASKNRITWRGISRFGTASSLEHLVRLQFSRSHELSDLGELEAMLGDGLVHFASEDGTGSAAKKL